MKKKLFKNVLTMKNNNFHLDYLKAYFYYLYNLFNFMFTKK